MLLSLIHIRRLTLLLLISLKVEGPGGNVPFWLLNSFPVGKYFLAELLNLFKCLRPVLLVFHSWVQDLLEVSFQRAVLLEDRLAHLIQFTLESLGKVLEHRSDLCLVKVGCPLVLFHWLWRMYFFLVGWDLGELLRLFDGLILREMLGLLLLFIV